MPVMCAFKKDHVLAASDVSEIENLDELEVYGDSDKNAGTTLTSYVFEVGDAPMDYSDDLFLNGVSKDGLRKAFVSVHTFFVP